MRYIIYLLLLVISAAACRKTNTEEQASDTDSIISAVQSINIQPDTLLLPDFSFGNIGFVEPAGYRGTEPEDYAHMFEEEWYDFYRDTVSGEYYLHKAELEVGKFYDDCLQDSTTYIASKRGSFFLIKGLQPKEAHIKSLPVNERNKHIWVGEQYTYTFNGRIYTLRGDGVTVNEDKVYMGDNEEPARWDEVINYRLYLSEHGVEGEQLLIAIPSFNDTFVELLWMGDLDEDGRIDFIFSVGRDYESRRVELFLSSQAVEGEIVRCAGESGYEFDC
ncbi:hypothetical protein [Prevotella sp. 10(H)]|uniref:hypothetical protein n=1 Tax=Prevotella sp. 10(H) TaxID=1158294 RepID=UPI0012DD554A|nr:hypothetical protein [Prevotella sp. 10(H)]